MKYRDVLEMEYKEQYNQYRWIGQMQIAVLTFYGVVTTIVAAAVAAFRPQAPIPIDYRWPAAIMIALGLLGIFVGYGLFRSRIMQRRTALYLLTVLVQMANSVDDASSVNDPALRFRKLCSTKGYFRLWDTMNIIILIAFYSGEFLILTGSLALLVVGNVFRLYDAALFGSISMITLVIFTPVVIQVFVMNKEKKRIDQECGEYTKVQTLAELNKHFDLPE